MKGHVRERGRGNWCAVIDIRDPETGKRKRKWHSLPGCKGKRQAQSECARIITEMGNGAYVEPSKTTVAQFLERWLSKSRRRSRHAPMSDTPRSPGKILFPLSARSSLPSYGPAHISAAYAKALASGRRDGKGGLSPRTVHHMHRILKQALKKALQWRELTHNPADA